jgi:hypothetical protein
MNQPDRVKRFFDQRKHAEDGTWTPPPGVRDATVRSADVDLAPVKSSGTDDQEIVWNPPVPSRRSPRRRRKSLDVLSQLFVQPFLWFVFLSIATNMKSVARSSLPYQVALMLLMLASVTTSFLLIALSVIDYQASLRDKNDDELDRMDRTDRRRSGN